MVNDSDIIDWYNAGWNKKRKWLVTIDTSLTTGRYAWVWETGEEIMDSYFRTFNVNPAGFNFLKYWPDEKGLIPNFLLPESLRVKSIEPAPLTLRMLAQSAKASKWLYD